ncbi:NAD(P)H-quinone oxidoreductase subunit 3 [Salinisphaera sp. USBA-960]|uniref:NADH-quinone oxidoreductase subunit A n=1 Tax=Salinisphaera orenii TaxID=856731 RepID=UPI000DBE3CA5|nr:NAD(P)H-quinone oxidoreductase subunit 3 [Salifodinibacter halophilus]NNC26286.1 NAD(P)H-quinone oxidoreductase subunit 3 [Salifodinibacter halophilus]
MNDAAQQSVTVWPLILFAAGALGLVMLMIGLSSILGGRHNEKLGNEPFESGIRPTGSAHQRFSVQFYLVAIIFVLFDLEVVFVFSYAIAAPALGWAGYGAFIFFLAIVTLGLAYEWRIGALNWAPKAPRQYRLAAIEANRARNLAGDTTNHAGDDTRQSEQS